MKRRMQERERRTRGGRWNKDQGRLGEKDGVGRLRWVGRHTRVAQRTTERGLGPARYHCTRRRKKNLEIPAAGFFFFFPLRPFLFGLGGREHLWLGRPGGNGYLTMGKQASWCGTLLTAQNLVR